MHIFFFIKPFVSDLLSIGKSFQHLSLRTFQWYQLVVHKQIWHFFYIKTFRILTWRLTPAVSCLLLKWILKKKKNDPNYLLPLCPQPLFSEDIGEPFTILHSVSHVQTGVHTMEVLLLRVQKDPQETKGSGYLVSLEWITVANTAEQGG